jgi:hypothetical protein
MPSVHAIVDYWRARPQGFFWANPFDVEPDSPRCFRYGCGVRVSHWGALERSHLVTRALDGLDNEPNIVMLCQRCNRFEMPDFRPGQWNQAILWVMGFYGYCVTDEIPLT